MDGAAPARGTLSAKKSSHIPINDPLDQKCSIHSQPIAKANSESSKPNKVHLEILANQIFSIFLFLILYPKNSFLPFALFCSYPQRSCPLHEVLNTAFDSTKLFFNYIYIYIYSHTVQHVGFQFLIQVSNESDLHIRWPKIWSFSFSISPSNKYSKLISFRMDRLDLLVVQGTLKSLLQHYSSKASICRHSAFFTIQLSHPYMITGKNITLTRWTFVGKVMSLLFNMLSRLVIAFLPGTSIF